MLSKIVINPFKPRKILVTHNGSFHSDDIFACATLELYLRAQGRCSRVVRSREERDFKRGDFVFDVGGIYDPEQNRFDHHQKGGAGERSNGVPYASFGLVWKKFGIELAGDAITADEIDKYLVQPIDAHDNGMDVYRRVHDFLDPITFQDVAGVFHPTEGAEPRDFDKAFRELVNFAKKILTKVIAQTKEQQKVNAYMRERYDRISQKSIAIVDIVVGRHAVTVGALSLPEVLYIVFPSRRGEWHVTTARDSMSSTKNRKPLPSEWGGKRDEELQKISGVPDATFCHNMLFLAGAKSRDGAIALAKKALNS